MNQNLKPNWMFGTSFIFFFIFHDEIPCFFVFGAECIMIEILYMDIKCKFNIINHAGCFFVHGCYKSLHQRFFLIRFPQ